MNLAVFRNFVLGGIVAASLAACGGSGGGSVASGGTGGTGIAYGSVTGFGSVIVNGVKFDTTNAAVTVNGLPGPVDDPHRGLAVGMVVRVEGSIDAGGTTGRAARITYSGHLEGPISKIVEIDPTTRQATVLSQTVIMDSQTAYYGGGLPDLRVGDVIEVSGHVDSQGHIHATYVERKDDMELEIKGTVSASDRAAKTFRIGALTVDYSEADTGDLPGGAPADGMFVEVKGARLEGDVLVASEVELEIDGIGDEDADEAEIEGIVTVVDADGFAIGNQRFVTTGSTSFKGGLVSDIRVGVKLEVEGTLANGVLTADEVEFRDSIKLESAVAAVNMDNSFTLKGLPGITVRWNDVTRVEDFSSASAIQADDLVKVRARMVGEHLVATSIEASEPEDSGIEVELQAPVESITGSVLEILGMSIDTGAITRFFDANENPLTPPQFLAALSADTLVEIEGMLSPDGTTVRWDEAEIED